MIATEGGQAVIGAPYPPDPGRPPRLEAGGWGPFEPYTGDRPRRRWFHGRPRRHDVDQRPQRTGGTHHLDGRFITDKPGFYRALGEALFGPGRWFGRGLDDLYDCLGGQRGVIGPFTLVWNDADIARHALDFTLDRGGKLTYLEEALQLLESRGVTVILR